MLRQCRPDAILHDMMAFAAHWAAREAGLPAVRLLPSYAQNETYRLRWPWAEDPEVLAAYEARQSKLNVELGVPRVEMNELMPLPGALNLVFLPRAFQPHGETFDGRFVFVGPCLVPREDRAAFDWSFAAGGKLLYVSLGTIFNQRPDFFRSCVEAFRDTDWRVVLALGQRVSAEELGQLPPNIFAGRYLPQLAILECSRLFLTHGGMNSVQGALYHGVPMAVFPQMREQQESAARVAELGLGLNLDRAPLTPEAFRAAVQTIEQTPAIRERVEAFRERVREGGGAPSAADAVETFISA